MTEEWRITRQDPPPLGELVLVKDPHGSYALAVRTVYNQGTPSEEIAWEDGHGAYLDGWERAPELWMPLPPFPVSKRRTAVR